MKPNAKAVKKIRKMIERIKADPKSYDQDMFPYLGSKGEITCETPFCAAGHLIALDKNAKKAIAAAYELVGSDPYALPWKEEAGKIVGVTEDLNRLFWMPEDWPSKFAEMYLKASRLLTERGRQKGKIRALEARWESFIETGV